MWKNGTIDVNGKLYDYQAKVYDEGSRFGIGGGRVSKLLVKRTEDKYWNNPVVSYDRGWDVEPADYGARKALEAVLGIYA
jgi:hypothetical protein